MYNGMGYYGIGQPPGTPTGTSTTTLTSTPGVPGPETWGMDPVAVALQSIAASILPAVYGQEDVFVPYAVQAIYQAGQIYPGSPDASQNACWTAAYVYTYYVAQQMVATGSTVSASGKITGGQLGPATAMLGGLIPAGTVLSVHALTQGMYAKLRAATYAMSYYGGCLINKMKGLNCTGGRLLVTGSAAANRPTYVRGGAARPPTGAPAPGTTAAAPAATSHTGLLLGGLAVAGIAAYVAFA